MSLKTFLIGGLIVSGMEYVGKIDIRLASIIGALPIGLASSYMLDKDKLVDFTKGYIKMLCIAILSATVLAYCMKNKYPKIESYMYVFVTWFVLTIGFYVYTKR